MKPKRILACIALVFVIACIAAVGVLRAHTFTLATEDGTAVKTEEIRPLVGKVRVSGDRDTSVVFTDVETGETRTVGYITQGVTETVRLQTGHWHTVEGAGDLTVGPVEVRVE